MICACMRLRKGLLVGCHEGLVRPCRKVGRQLWRLSTEIRLSPLTLTCVHRSDVCLSAVCWMEARTAAGAGEQASKREAIIVRPKRTWLSSCPCRRISPCPVPHVSIPPSYDWPQRQHRPVIGPLIVLLNMSQCFVLRCPAAHVARGTKVWRALSLPRFREMVALMGVPGFRCYDWVCAARACGGEVCRLTRRWVQIRIASYMRLVCA